MTYGTAVWDGPKRPHERKLLNKRTLYLASTQSANEETIQIDPSISQGDPSTMTRSLPCQSPREPESLYIKLKLYTYPRLLCCTTRGLAPAAKTKTPCTAYYVGVATLHQGMACICYQSSQDTSSPRGRRARQQKMAMKQIPSTAAYLFTERLVFSQTWTGIETGVLEFCEQTRQRNTRPENVERSSGRHRGRLLKKTRARQIRDRQMRTWP